MAEFVESGREQCWPPPIPQRRTRKRRGAQIGQVDGAEDDQAEGDPPAVVRRMATSDERRLSSPQPESSTKAPSPTQVPRVNTT